MSCPCACTCNGPCNCLNEGCPCTTWESDHWHVPRLIKRTPKSDEGLPGLYTPGCTCRWEQAKQQPEKAAWKSARAHTRAANRDLEANINRHDPGDWQELRHQRMQEPGAAEAYEAARREFRP